MYSNKFVACVKSNGQVLREKGETVFLPFGSEYTLWFKNENDRKVQIEVSIDGTDVLHGRALLLEAGDTMDLKGFVRDMYGDDNRAFKFITKTQQISDFRGDKIEDGLVKIKYTFEKEPYSQLIKQYVSDRTFTFDNYYNQGSPYTYGSQYPTTKGDINSNVSYSAFDTLGGEPRAKSASFDTPVSKNVTRGNVRGFAPSDDPGITVEGSATNQSFQEGRIGVLENKTYTMIFQLKGLTETEKVEEPITVKTKKVCTTCGKLWTGNYEYCPNDGSYLRFT